jgi:hypothetical protein
MAQGFVYVSAEHVAVRSVDTHAVVLEHGVLVKTYALTSHTLGLGAPHEQGLHVAGFQTGIDPPRTWLLAPAGHPTSAPASAVVPASDGGGGLLA